MIKKLKKYLGVYRIIINNGFSYVTQYRSDNWINFIIHIGYLWVLLIVIQIIFGQTDSLLGWNKQEMYLLTIFWTIVDNIYIVFFANSVSLIPDRVVEGQLDVLITKPINSLFIVSTTLFSVRALYRLAINFVLLGWLFFTYDFGFYWLHVIIFPILVFFGVMIEYSIYLIANTFSFWLNRIDNINSAIDFMRGIARFPLDIFGKYLKLIFFIFLPIAFMAYIPVGGLVGKFMWYHILLSFLFILIFFLLAVSFWNYAIKRYSSASS